MSGFPSEDIDDSERWIHEDDEKELMREELRVLEEKMAKKEQKRRLLAERARLQALVRTQEHEEHSRPDQQEDPIKEQKRALLRAERDKLRAAQRQGDSPSVAHPLRVPDRDPPCKSEQEDLRALQAKVAAAQMEAERVAAKKLDAERRGNAITPGCTPYTPLPMPTKPPLEERKGAAAVTCAYPVPATPTPSKPPTDDKKLANVDSAAAASQEKPSQDASSAKEDLAIAADVVEVAANVVSIGLDIARIALAF